MRSKRRHRTQGEEVEWIVDLQVEVLVHVVGVVPVPDRRPTDGFDPVVAVRPELPGHLPPTGVSRKAFLE